MQELTTQEVEQISGALLPFFAVVGLAALDIAALAAAGKALHDAYHVWY